MISLKLTTISRVRENRVRSWFNLPRFILTSARNQWSGSCQSSSSEHSYRPAHGNPAAANFSALLSFCLQLRSTSKQAKRTIWTFEKMFGSKHLSRQTSKHVQLQHFSESWAFAALPEQIWPHKPNRSPKTSEETAAFSTVSVSPCWAARAILRFGQSTKCGNPPTNSSNWGSSTPAWRRHSMELLWLGRRFHWMIWKNNKKRRQDSIKGDDFWLVVPSPLKNMNVNWDDVIPNIWENKKCSKPPTRFPWN